MSDAHKGEILLVIVFYFSVFAKLHGQVKGNNSNDIF